MKFQLRKTEDSYANSYIDIVGPWSGSWWSGRASSATSGVPNSNHFQFFQLALKLCTAFFQHTSVFGWAWLTIYWGWSISLSICVCKILLFLSLSLSLYTYIFISIKKVKISTFSCFYFVCPKLFFFAQPLQYLSNSKKSKCMTHALLLKPRTVQDRDKKKPHRWCWHTNSVRLYRSSWSGWPLVWLLSCTSHLHSLL